MHVRQQEEAAVPVVVLLGQVVGLLHTSLREVLSAKDPLLVWVCCYPLERRRSDVLTCLEGVGDRGGSELLDAEGSQGYLQAERRVLEVMGDQ